MHLRRSFAALPRHAQSSSPGRLFLPQRGISAACATVSLFLTLLILLSTAAAQTTIHVPADQPTIQAGINAANTGDTVLVAPGTYYENIDFIGKAITVTSSAGPATTIIDGKTTLGAPTVTMSGTTKASVISNFTIRNGGYSPPYQDINPAAGVYVAGSAATILNNVITANSCEDILVAFGAAIIQGNEISGALNNNPDYCSYPASGIAIQGNAAVGGLTYTEIIGNTIENNLNGEFDGALSLQGSNVIVLNNIIRNNQAGEGAITTNGAINIAFIQNLVYGNTARGVSQAPQGAGGLTFFAPSYVPPYSGIFANNVFFNNTTSGPYAASQIYFDGNVSGYVLLNNIIYGSGSLPALMCSPNYAGGSPPLADSYNDVFNPSGPAFGGICASTAGSNGNISADPLFNKPTTGDFHVLAGSPVIDSGANSAVASLAPFGVTLPSDFDGNVRIQNATGKGCVIDMGAYEYSGSVSNCGISETLTSTFNPATVGQNITFTAQLTAATGIPTGTIQFLDGAIILSTQTVSSTGSASFATTSLAVGSHTITAIYQPTGAFSASTASLTEVINGYTTATNLTCVPNPIAFGSSAIFTAIVTSTYGTPTGSIAFTDNGSPLGTQSLVNGTASLTHVGFVPGTHTIAAAYSPTGTFAASSATCSELASPLATISVLKATPSTSNYGSPVTLSATVSPAPTQGPNTPTGLVTFYDGVTPIAVVSLDASGQATFTTSTLAVGTHPLTAVYAGDTIHATSTSLPFSETINPLPPDFTITLASPTVTIKTQHHLTTTLTLTSLNSFADTLALVCANLPTYVTCRPTPNPAPLTANGSTTVSLYLDTDSVLGYAHNTANPQHGSSPTSSLRVAVLLSPFGLFAALLARRRRSAHIRLFAILLAAIPLSFALAGCGEIITPYDVPPSAAPGTYILPITATGASSAVSHTAQLTIQITP